MRKILFLAVCQMATGLFAQTNDNVFNATTDDGKAAHVVPSTDVLERHFGRKASLAKPSSTATVYPPSYGTGNLISHGGPEISNAGFQAIYWNSSVATSSSTSNGYATIQNQVDAFITSFADNQNWDNSATDDYTIIQQYGTGSPIAPTLTLNPVNSGQAFIDSQIAPSTITDSQIQTYLAGLFSSGKLPVNSNTIYGVIFPAGTSVQLSSNQASCTYFCAYHSGFYYQGTTPIIYAVFPYPNCGGCNPYGYPAADMLTMFIGHETREAVTDAYGAWYDSSGYEADDKCAWSNLYRTANGNFFVQPEYSNGGTVTASGFTATYPGPGCVVPSASCTAPPAPNGLTATPGNGQVSLHWTAVSGAGSYNVKRGTFSGGESQLASATTNSYTDTTAMNGTRYYYVVTALASCGTHPESGNSNEASATPGAGGDFTVSASPGSQTVAQGGQTTYTVTIGALNGFSGAVSLSATGLPSGVSATFNPASITGSGSSTLTLTASSTAATGTVTLLITGASGSLSHTASATLTVTAIGPAPDFTISAAPASQSVTRGNSTTYTVTVTPLNSFTGTVSLSASSVPSRTRASFNPSSITASGTSTLTVSTGTRAARGTYKLNIRGASGSLNRATTVTLIIQ
ncbi:MAG: hypothetical protein LAP39_22890 [Acidobacteriia bacterium]|nr:hypothetical protein [Terriglobia bacterium]